MLQKENKNIENVESIKKENSYYESIIDDNRESSNSKKLLFLSQSAIDLIGFETRDEIYAYIGKMLSEQVSDSIVFVNEADSESNDLTLKCLYGLQGSLLERGLKLLGKNPIGNTVPMDDDLLEIFMSGKLNEFKGGLKEFAKKVVSEKIANGLHILLGLNKIYTVGIAKDNMLFAVTHIFTRKKAVVEDFSFIETFMNQSSTALQKKYVEEELVKAKEKAEESDRLKSAFLANMSHEIRTPLNAILGFAELMMEPGITDEQRKLFTSYIYSGGERLLRIISDIVDISKIEANQLSLQIAPSNLKKLMNDLYAQYNVVFANKNVKLEMKLDPDEDELIMYTDESRLFQILSNLIENAGKFTPDGKIQFGFQIRQNEIVFYVKDTGIGIEKKDIYRVFDRFFQASYNNSKPAEGAGLGLSIVKGLVDLMNGKISVDSTPNKETKFTITLPYESCKAEEKQDLKKENVNFELGGHFHIMVVEDEIPNFLYLKEILKTEHVTHAKNGKEAIELLEKGDFFDLIFMDIKMPVMDGLTAARNIRDKKISIPIIAQSAFAFNQDRENALKAGCNDFIAKPFTKSQVIHAIKRNIPV